MATRAVFILDPSLTFSEEDEVEMLLWDFDEQGIELDIIATSGSPLILDEHNPDMVIIDYGGISTMGGWATARANVEYVCEWAENHPGKPVVIWTYFTYQVYRDELEDAFGGLDNILIREERISVSPELEDIFWEEIKLWLGVTDDKELRDSL